MSTESQWYTNYRSLRNFRVAPSLEQSGHGASCVS